MLTLLEEAQRSLSIEELAWLNAPAGHPVYNNPHAGQEKAEVAIPPGPPGANRPAGRAPGVMSAIIEAQPPPPKAEQNSVTWTVGGT